MLTFNNKPVLNVSSCLVADIVTNNNANDNYYHLVVFCFA